MLAGDAMKNAFVLLVFGLLALPVLAQDQAAGARAAAGCGADKVQFEVAADKKLHTEGKAEAGKAVVYVFEDERRDPNQRLGNVTIRIGLDGKWVGANHGKSYFFFSVEPGQHALCANWQSSFRMYSKLASAASLTAEAGKVYYFRASVERENGPFAGSEDRGGGPGGGAVVGGGFGAEQFASEAVKATRHPRPGARPLQNIRVQIEPTCCWRAAAGRPGLWGR